MEKENPANAEFQTVKEIPFQRQGISCASEPNYLSQLFALTLE